ncbi:hypothetical protein [Methylobacillus flagellatus]|uniref:hypothetical protein n=1 Tax=Methylobacillus flagellatus TaxID=405 RepID=UPI0006629532|nr:hypothetical protein [Methylobacillus flagellatus]
MDCFHMVPRHCRGGLLDIFLCAVATAGCGQGLLHPEFLGYHWLAVTRPHGSDVGSRFKA